MACALGHISGCHLNPSVRSAWASPLRRRCGPVSCPGPGALYCCASNRRDHWCIRAVPDRVRRARIRRGREWICIEWIRCAFTRRLFVDGRVISGFGPLAIGLCLTLIHLISIPVTNTSVNPARSTGPALFTGGAALGQLWLFWVAPIIGACITNALYPRLFPEKVAAVAPAPMLSTHLDAGWREGLTRGLCCGAAVWPPVRLARCTGAWHLAPPKKQMAHLSGPFGSRNQAVL